MDDKKRIEIIEKIIMEAENGDIAEAAAYHRICGVMLRHEEEKEGGR